MQAHVISLVQPADFLKVPAQWAFWQHVLKEVGQGLAIAIEEGLHGVFGQEHGASVAVTHLA
jgi:hypothetical protein